MLEAQQVTRSFKVGAKTVDVLKGVSLIIGDGERLFLTGPSGAGKTTLLYTLAGLERPDGGTISLAGRDIYALSKAKQADVRNREMGYVFQNYFLLPELTALENVALPAMIGRRRAKRDAESLLERVGLSGRLNHLPAELSGGEQQRVAIARALINDPRIVFADEPTGNLDSSTGSKVMEMLLSVVADSRKALIVVTHDAGLAQLGDRRVHLSDGRIAS